MIRVLLVEDHPMMRVGIASILAAEPDLDVAGEAGDADEAVRLVARLRPDLVLMDLRLPGRDGVAATAELRRTAPTVPVIVLTGSESAADLVRAIEAGAIDYLLKDSVGEQLVAAIRAAVEGRSRLADPVARHLADRLRTPHPADAISPRERQVLQHVARGHTNAEIARLLFIGEETVKTHLLRIFRKLHVTDRTAAVTTAIAAGVLSPQDAAGRVD